MWCNPGAIDLICVYLQAFLDRHVLLAMSKYEARIAEVQTKITPNKNADNGIKIRIIYPREKPSTHAFTKRASATAGQTIETD